MGHSYSALVWAVVLLGCTVEQSEPPAPALPNGCAEGELAIVDGACIRPGIGPDGCAPGFVHDGGYGCNAVLPDAACPPGRMAVPGESECRPIMACAEGRWGDIPVEPSTEYVDGSYMGGQSDGSEARPWTRIVDAVAAAPSGALVAVARGTYSEDVVIADKPIRLWGVCPEEVSIVSTGQQAGMCPAAAVCVASGASGTELVGVSLSGAGLGMTVSGAEQVVADRVWLHDAALGGVDVEDHLGATSLTLRDSLIEQNHDLGIFAASSEVIVEASVVRTTLPNPSEVSTGRGIYIRSCNNAPTGPVCGTRASLTVRGSLVEQNHDLGIFVANSDALVEATVVRTTSPRVADSGGGRGITIQGACADTPTGPVCNATARANATVRGSLVEQNHEIGLSIMGSDALVEASVVRNTAPRPSDQIGGRGINIQLMCGDSPSGVVCEPATRANATVRGSLIEQNQDAGLVVSGSEALVEASVVRTTAPNAFDGTYGRGISIELSCIDGPLGNLICDPAARANATVRDSLVEDNYDNGIYVGGADAHVETSLVRATSPRMSDGLYGDGVAVATSTAPAFAELWRVRIDDSARAGLSNFGATVELGASRIGCAAFPLNGEAYEGADYAFADRGDNLCGCPSADALCKLVSGSLEPPAPPVGSQ